MIFQFSQASSSPNLPDCGKNNNNNGSLEFSLADLALVREIHAFDALILKLLVHSLCPSIYGHEVVKAGMLLGLFGGTSSGNGGGGGGGGNDKNRVNVRGDPHVSSFVCSKSWSGSFSNPPRKTPPLPITENSCQVNSKQLKTPVRKTPNRFHNGV